MDNEGTGRTKLRAWLAAYGHASRRWPLERLNARQELDASPKVDREPLPGDAPEDLAQARREAQALDQLLDQARAPKLDRAASDRMANAVLARIAALPAASAGASADAAVRRGQAGNVVDFTASRNKLRQNPVSSTERLVRRGPAAALLAASLVLGVGLGISASVPDYVGDVALSVFNLGSDAQVAIAAP